MKLCRSRGGAVANPAATRTVVALLIMALTGSIHGSPINITILPGGVAAGEPIQIAVKPAADRNDPNEMRLANLLLGGLYTGPYFDPYTPTDISVQVGSNALLPCRVRQAGNRSVSWVRKTDGHLLSVGDDTFINDARFKAQRITSSDTWTLQIRSVQLSDSGEYECQVSSNEPKISRIVRLRAIEPVVSIKGAPDMYVKHGSPVTLHCQISSFIQSPGHVEWHLNGTLIAQVKNHPYSTGQQQQQQHFRGSAENNAIISAATDASGRTTVLERLGNDSLRLTLSLPSVSQDDSGQYQCVPSNMAPANVSFNVVIGEHPAAMQHGDNDSGRPYPAVIALLVSFFASSGHWCRFHILSTAFA